MDLSQIHSGKRAAPRRVLLYGTHGVGKSTFGARAERPIFIQTEDGLGEIDCDKFPLATSYGDSLAAIGALFTEQHSYRTVVVDSLDWLERLIWTQVCKERDVQNIEDIGYGKGYVFALTPWRDFLDGLNALRNQRSMTIILIAHAKIERFENPETDSYDRYVPRLHKLASASDDQRAVMAAIYARQNPKPRGRPKENATPRGVAFSKKRQPARQEAATLLNVSAKQIEKAVELLDRAPDLAEKVRTGEMPLGKARKRCEAEQQRQALAVAAASLPPADDRFHLHVGDFCDVCNSLPKGSIDAIITDPPYPKEFLPVYGRLAEVAARLLKPGGSLVVMVGQSYMPEIVAAMAQHLAYRWMLAYLTPGGQAPQIWDRKVNTFWKPVLWFTAGTYQGDWIGDVVNTAANDNDKRFHHWGQGEGGMCRLVERFTKPGDTVLDPFLGGGTTGVVTVRLQRRFIGIDCDEKALDTARARIALAAREAAV